MAEWLADNMNKIAYDVLYNSPVTELYRGLQKKYDVQGKPFIFQVSIWSSRICKIIYGMCGYYADGGLFPNYANDMS